MFPNSKQWLAATCVVGLAVMAARLLSATADSSIVAAAVPEAQAKADAFRHYAAVPMSFERNEGQVDASVAYLSRGPGYSVFLTRDEAVFSLRQKRHANDPKRVVPGSEPAGAASQAVIRMSLVGANQRPVIEGRGLQAGKSHYLQGNDAARWRGNVARYGKVQYRDVYPGIDLVYYGNQRELEYDFLVAPGRDPDQIVLGFSGMASLRLNAAGNLVLQTAVGEVIQHKPVVYQEVAGKRVPIEGAYRLLAGNRVGFTVDRYDTSLPLVIDPIFAFTSYLGGNTGDQVIDLAVDKDANLYALGCTAPFSFGPLNYDHDGVYPGCDVFVTKFNSDLTRTIYTTFVGGAGDDVGLAIKIDGNGNPVVAGYTSSTNFPTKSPLQPGLLGSYDGFVFKLDATGDAFAYSTYLGGAGEDRGLALALDTGGNVYVAGETLSDDFPIKGSVTGNTFKGVVDGFLTKLNGTGSAILMSRYLGGSNEDFVFGVVADVDGNAYVTGMTTSPDFPLVSPAQWYGGSNDAFVTKIGSDGAIAYSTCLGGDYVEFGQGIALDHRGRVAVVGFTSSIGPDPFPTTPSAAQPAFGGGVDGFVAVLDASGSSFVFSTLLGGSGDDYLREVEFDRRDSVYVVGDTTSSDVPGPDPKYLMQATNRGGSDAFAARYLPGGTMVWSTYLGGSGDEYGYALALYGTGNIFVGGSTGSTNLALQAPLQATFGGTRDGFVSRLAYRQPVTLAHEFNGDYFGDILWRKASTGESVIWRSASNAYQGVTKTSTTMQIAGVGDFNCDGKADTFWRNTVTGANTIWLSANSATPMAVTAVTNLAWYVAAVGDFNGDCEADIIWRNSSNGTNALWLSGDYAKQGEITSVTNRDWKILGVGDFNGDFFFDVLWRNQTTGGNAIWLVANYGNQQSIPAVHSGWNVAGIGDFLGDGRSDILWRNPTSGDNVIWRQGDYNDQQRLPWVHPDWAAAAVADYNNDGRSDILWRNGSTGQNAIWRSASPTNVQAVTSVTDFGWKVVP